MAKTKPSERRKLSAVSRFCGLAVYAPVLCVSVIDVADRHIYK